MILILSACSDYDVSQCQTLLDGQEYKIAATVCGDQFEKSGDVATLENWIEALAAQKDFPTIHSLIDKASGEPYEADALFYAAHALRDSGDTTKATQYYHSSAEHFARGDRFSEQAQSLHQLFRIEWKQSKHRSALAYAASSLSAAQKGQDRQGEIMALKDLFIVFEEVGSLGPAQQALSMIDEKLANDTSSGNRINAYISQGLLNMSLRQFGMAEHSFQQALMAASGSKNSSALRGLHLNIVHANIMLDRLEAAEKHMKIAWSHANADGSVQFALLFYQSLLQFHKGEYSPAYDVMQQALQDPDLPSVWTWEMHYWAGEAAHEMGDVELAIASYQRSINASEGLRKQLGVDQLKAHLLSRKRDAYEALFIEFFDAGRYLDAFAVSEQAKTRSFVDAYVKATEVSSANDTPEIAFSAVSERIDNLQTYLQNMSASPIAQIDNIETVIDKLGERSLLSYFKAKQRMFVIGVDQQAVSILELPLDYKSVSKLFHTYEENLNDDEVLAKLGMALFPDAVFKESGSHLYIAPDDFIGRVALATLRKDNKYFIENRTFSLIPSAGSLVKIEAAADLRTDNNHYSILGDPQGDLPAAGQEVSAAARALGAIAWTGSDATFTRLLENPSPDILHIASHSGINHLGPWVRFADGDITGGTILRKRIRPRLAVLASCASGTGQDRYLWGSLGGLFLSSGTSSVIVSLWSIEDAVAQAMMSRYYSGYASENSVAKTLALVQRQAIREGVEPQQWGSFTVLGLP